MRWGQEPEFFGPRQRFRHTLIVRQLKGRIGAASKVLDAGSGNGALAIRIGRCGYSVLGIDQSSDFISYSRTRAHEAMLSDRVAFQEGNVLRSRLEDGLFDAVVSGELLEHLEEDYEAVREFHRLLRPGGLCVATVPAHPHRWDRVDEWAGHVRRYRREELEGVFQDQGFVVEKCHYWGFPLVYFYNRFIYLPMAHTKMRRQGVATTGKDNMFSRVMKSERLYRFVSALFTFDMIFDKLPMGIGLLLVARKKGTDHE